MVKTMNLFNTEEDKVFSDYVRHYNDPGTTVEERDKMLPYIEERTKRLLYMIPKRNLLMEDEDLAAFFLELQKDMKRYIEDFSLSGTSYNAYLTQICRFRAKRYRRDKSKARFTEIAMTRDLRFPENKGAAIGEMKEAAVDYGSRHVNCKNLGMKEILSKLCDEIQPYTWTNKNEKKLGTSLRERKCRQGFIMYLLHMPVDSEPEDLKAVARVLGTYPEVLMRLLELKHQMLSADVSRKERIESNTSLADGYWVFLQRLSLSIEYEWDEGKIQQMREKYEKYMLRLRKKQKLLHKLRRGLTQMQIARLFGCSRTKVSVYLDIAQKEMEEAGN